MRLSVAPDRNRCPPNIRVCAKSSRGARLEYDLELDRVRGQVESLGARRVLLQLPDGLKGLRWCVVDELEGCGVEVIVDGGHAWGVCDLALERARLLGADALIHYGHLDVKRPLKLGGVSVVMAPARYRWESPEAALERLADALAQFRVIALSSSVQHSDDLLLVARFLRERGHTVYIGRSPLPHFRVGQVVGCDVAAASSVSAHVDAHVCVSGGIFHAVGVAIATGKPTIALDPYRGVVERERVEGFVRRLLARKLRDLSEAAEARAFAVIVSAKPGQRRLDLALRAVSELRRAGRRAELVVLDEVTRDELLNLSGVDALVNTACPRLGLDDLELFEGLTVVNIGELKYIISDRLEEYDLRSALAWRMNPGFVSELASGGALRRPAGARR
ncbi:MAG: diphthamide biosynthesis enzyme Dph2 [Thermoprotei archaeon]|nr:MAG: diphthamide biosynthesis enzyme Dph2 [Thermoprotei archaeon]